MSDLNWNKLPWRKSSFSSDSANCVEVSWTRSSACHQGSCVEVGWTSSSLCAGGDCVQVRHDDDVVYVRDSKLGDDSPVQEWPLTYWEFLCDAIVADLPRFSGFRKLDDGGVELRWEHIHPAPLIFDDGEWKAFVLGVRAGEFDPEKLSEGVSAGSGSVAGSGEAAAGTDVSWGGAVPVAAEQSLDDYLDTITWIEDPSLGEPQGPPAGRPVDVSADEVDLSSAVQPGFDAAGTGVPPDPVPVAPEYGDLVMRRVEPRFIVDQAPERTLMSLGLLQSADERALFVAGGDTIYFGYDHESMGQFVYQVVGWDAERRGLILERISPASEAIDAELAKAAAPLVPAVETQETVS
jgi:hypothetical protein